MSNIPGYQRLADQFVDSFHTVARTESMKPSYIDSFRIEPTPRGFRATVYHVAASFLEHGTKRHWVEPNRAPVMTWERNGERYFSMGHWISGVQPRHVLEKARAKFVGVVGNARVS